MGACYSEDKSLTISPSPEVLLSVVKIYYSHKDSVVVVAVAVNSGSTCDSDGVVEVLSEGCRTNSEVLTVLFHFLVFNDNFLSNFWQRKTPSCFRIFGQKGHFVKRRLF